MTEQWRFAWVLILSIMLSLAGVLIAVFWVDATHGGRGGALAVALSLLALFATRDTSSRIYKALTERALRVRGNLEELRGGTAPVRLSPDERLDAFETKLRLDAEGSKTQNIFLAMATAFGTVFWGFGDLLALWLRSLL
jgi:hypothetical protein